MEEEILKIIERDIKLIGWDELGNPIYIGSQHKAKEITLHILKFIEWLTTGDHLFFAEGNGLWLFFEKDDDTMDDDLGHLMTTEQVYQYWWTQIENIEKNENNI
jgi:hypothetical protein